MPSRFQRFLLPGFAFKAVVIGGGYATGRELAESLPADLGRLSRDAAGTVVWAVVCVATFLFARRYAASRLSDIVRALSAGFHRVRGSRSILKS